MNSDALLVRRLRTRLAAVEGVANVTGALMMGIFLRALHGVALGVHELGIDDAALLLYLALALPMGWAWCERRCRLLWRWLLEDRPAKPRERDLALRAPLHAAFWQAMWWAAGAVLFGTLMLSESLQHASEVALAIVLGGVTTSVLAYLGVERLLRPVTARALATEPPEQPTGPGVPTRLITAWALASGIPMLGLALLAIRALSGEVEPAESLAVPVLIVAVAGLGAGSLAALLSARALADPLGAVRRGLARVNAGDLDVQVAVDDGSEVGLLQAGFNEMTAGLRERERLRDLFGRHVGVEVARRAVAEAASLGGEVRDVAVLFVDIVGSTALAASRPPEQVVRELNRFFAVVIDAAEAHGGWVNKFEGDAALCIFGAPADQPDTASSALAAARTLRSRLRDELPELDAGIGVAAGPAMAGNVGSERRLEYTVIGDPVNEAARLCELAKSEPARVLASATTLARASADEAVRWELGEEVVLRGRAIATRLAIPARDRAYEEVSRC